MPTERSMKAAKLLSRTTFVSGVNDDAEHVADLIDRAAGLPELEARVAQLERLLRNIEHGEEWDALEARCIAAEDERDALKARVAELKQQLATAQHIAFRLQIERDAALRKLEAVGARLARLVEAASELLAMHLGEHDAVSNWDMAVGKLSTVLREIKEQRDAEPV